MEAAHTSRSLASQALSNLVNQFARPLDFLRELVQNSLDAGTPRVEVSVGYEGEGADGVVSIQVDDFGEGMDEAIIDDQLTRLFSSTKEDDLTKIGKFGIGFTSIFAIRPDAVLVHTGRHGEYWELLFHADRTFEKVRVDKPVTGTKITLFKKMPRNELDRFVREARYVLGYWCEHSHTPITFSDRTRVTAQTAAPESHDPFAAFAAPTTAPTVETVNSPFGLTGTDLHTSRDDDGIEVAVGLGDNPRYGYYNGGLTLVNSVNRDVLGSFADRLGHVSFKVRYDRLEHTLTRDNVLQDAQWQKVMNRVVVVADELRHSLLDKAEAACQAGEELPRWHAWLARECEASDGRNGSFFDALRGRRIFAGHREPLTLDAVERQERSVGRVLLHPGDGPVADAIDESGRALVRADDATQALLLALEPPKVLGLIPSRRRLIDAGTRFLLPQIVAEPELGRDEGRLIDRANQLLHAATRGRAKLAVGAFGGEGTLDDLVVEGPRDGRLFERKGDGWLWLPTFLRWRTLLLNRHHPHVRVLVAVSMAEPDLAALALAQAVLTYEDLESDATFERLFAKACEGDP